MKEDLLEKLYEELPVNIKPGGQGFKFIKTKDVINRLNRSFEGAWSTEVIMAQKVEQEYVVQVRVSRHDDEGRTLNWHDGFGSAKFYNNAEMGNIYKSAKSKAIKDAAKSFGVGLMLNTGQGGNGNYAQDADATEGTQAVINNTDLPNQGGFTGTTPPPGFQGAETAPQNSPPQGNVPPTPIGGEVVVNNTPPGNASFPPNHTATKETVLAEEPPLPQGLPSMNNAPPQGTQALPPVQNSTNTEAPTPQTPVVEGDMLTAKITHIQKIVFDQRVQASGIPFKEYVNGKFQELGITLDYDFETVDDLLYKDALLVVANQ